jgi:hypothetical protein
MATMINLTDNAGSMDDLDRYLPEPITINEPPLFCVTCREEESNFQFIQTWEESDIGGLFIPIYAEYFRCINCEEEMEVVHEDYHPLQDAYEEYEEQTGVAWRGSRRPDRLGLEIRKEKETK